MLTIAVEFFQDLSLLGWDWISQRRWTLLLIQFSGERRPASQPGWAGISPITSGWGSPRPRPRRVTRQQSLLIMPPPPSDNWPGYWVYTSFASSKILLLLAWLVVCQHLTKHPQTFSHSLPRPSFPYVLLRLQYVSSPRKCPNGSILQHQQAGHKLFGANLSLCDSLSCLSLVQDFCDL